jgi:hypothetical protein
MPLRSFGLRGSGAGPEPRNAGTAHQGVSVKREALNNYLSSDSAKLLVLRIVGTLTEMGTESNFRFEKLLSVPISVRQSENSTTMTW